MRKSFKKVQFWAVNSDEEDQQDSLIAIYFGASRQSKGLQKQKKKTLVYKFSSTLHSTSWKAIVWKRNAEKQMEKMAQ